MVTLILVAAGMGVLILVGLDWSTEGHPRAVRCNRCGCVLEGWPEPRPGGIICARCSAMDGPG
jgi:hypothetical protein